MAKTKKELIELMKFTVNDKANTASSLMNQKAGDKKHFYHGQYMAFTEMYSMLESIERTENNE